MRLAQRQWQSSGNDMAAGAGVAPASAPSKGAVLRLDDPAFFEMKMEDGKLRMLRHETAILNLLSSILAGKEWPARVTRPVLRIKSPLHHFNACRPKLARRAETWRAKAGARGRICTCAGDALDVVPLLVGLHELAHLRLVFFTN